MKRNSISEALRVARKRYALGGGDYGQTVYEQLMRDVADQKKLPLPKIAPLTDRSQPPTQTPDSSSAPADKTPDAPASDTTPVRRPIDGGGGGDGFAPAYQGIPTGKDAALPSAMPETIDLTTGQQSGKTGIGPLDRAIANPGTTAVNFAAGFIPVVGPLNTVSGLLGGPTIGSMGRNALESLSKEAQPTGAIPSNVQNLVSDQGAGAGRGTVTEGLNDRAMQQYADAKGHALSQNPNADLTAMAAMMYGETRGKADALPAGMSAINRSMAMGQPVGAIISAPNQYDGYNPAAIKAVSDPSSIKNPIERQAALNSIQKATDLMTGKAEATHGKGTPYGSITSFNQASPAYNYNTPSQGAVKGSAIVGDPHTFYTVNNLAAPLARAQAQAATRAAQIAAQQEQVAQQQIDDQTGTPGVGAGAVTPTSDGRGSAQVASNAADSNYASDVGSPSPSGPAGSQAGNAPSGSTTPSTPTGQDTEDGPGAGAVSSPAGTGPALSGDTTGASATSGATPGSPGSAATPGSTTSSATPSDSFGTSPGQSFGTSLSSSVGATVSGPPLGSIDPASLAPLADPNLNSIPSNILNLVSDPEDPSLNDMNNTDSTSEGMGDTGSSSSDSMGGLGGDDGGGGMGGTGDSGGGSSGDGSSGGGSGGDGGGGGGGDGGGGGGGGEKRGGLVQSQHRNRNMIDKALKVVGRKKGGKVSAYPLKPDNSDRKHAGYSETGGKMQWMSPDKFLEQSEKMQMDKGDKKSIKKFKKKMEKGKKLNPLALYPSGGQDGRHRATAAEKLGIKKVPVITWPGKAEGGSIVNRALMVASKSANRQRGRP